MQIDAGGGGTQAFNNPNLPRIIAPVEPLQCSPMKCPGCGTDMTAMTLEGRLATQVSLDVCAACQAFWFDHFESLQLSPASTLKLMKFIGEHPGKASLSNVLKCPRCAACLLPTHDLQRSTRFSYWRCDKEHGRIIRFLDLLKEKNFIRP